MSDMKEFKGEVYKKAKIARDVWDRAKKDVFGKTIYKHSNGREFVCDVWHPNCVVEVGEKLAAINTGAAMHEIMCDYQTWDEFKAEHSEFPRLDLLEETDESICKNNSEVQRINKLIYAYGHISFLYNNGDYHIHIDCRDGRSKKRYVKEIEKILNTENIGYRF